MARSVKLLGPTVLSVLLAVWSSIEITTRGGGPFWLFFMVAFGLQSIREIKALPTTP